MRTPVIVSAVRTPSGKFLGSLKALQAPQLGAIVVREAVSRAGIDPAAVEECIMGNVLTAGVGQAPARQAALGAGLSDEVAALTINKVCGSGLKAVMLAAQGVGLGDVDIAVAGGMESMSNAPYLLSRAREGLRMGDASLVDSMIHDGLWCAVEHCHMGMSGEHVADVYGVLPLYSNVRADSLTPLALRAVDRAIAIDSSLPDAFVSRGAILQAGWRWNEAEASYRRALALDPDNATAHQWLGELLLLHGRLDESRAELRRATELDPVSPVMLGSYALALAAGGTIDQAIAAGRRAVELDSSLVVGRFMLGSVYLQAGRFAEGITELETAQRVDPANVQTIGLLGYAYARAGERPRRASGRRSGRGGRDRMPGGRRSLATRRPATSWSPAAPVRAHRRSPARFRPARRRRRRPAARRRRTRGCFRWRRRSAAP